MAVVSGEDQPAAGPGGYPGALIARTSQLAYTSGETSGWYDLTFSAPVSLAAGTYWTGVFTGGSSGVAGFRYTSVSGARDYNVNTYSNGPSNPFGSFGSFGSFTTDSEGMSLYGTLG